MCMTGIFRPLFAYYCWNSNGVVLPLHSVVHLTIELSETTLPRSVVLFGEKVILPSTGEIIDLIMAACGTMTTIGPKVLSVSTCTK
jgi:hypothetical protein